MSPSLILSIIVVYFLILLLIAFIGRKDNDNYAFFLGKRQSPWYIVAFGMLGASISGISFISVPGMAAYSGFTYMQMVVGFSIGYVVIAYLLLPLYYKIGTTSIYEYLGMRFGIHSHRTGTCFFILSRALGGAARIFVAAVIIQTFVFGHWNIPFWLTSVILISLIYLYTFTNGIKTIVWTDALQTFFLLSALIVLFIQAFPLVSFKNVEIPQFVVFDINSKADFFKMLLSGIFITITMTGLDQDMMQKNLSCKSLRDAKKNMLSYGAAFIPINLLFLFLGWMLCIIYANNGQVLPANTDNILPNAISLSYLGQGATIFFILGIVSATFSSADSTLISLTTSVSVDLLHSEQKQEKTAKRIRQYTHIFMCLLFVFLMIIFNSIDNRNIIDVLFKIASYTYGPLLGLFTFGIFTKKKIHDKFVPIIACLSPIICLIIQSVTNNFFGYELLIINGLITFLGLIISSIIYENKNRHLC